MTEAQAAHLRLLAALPVRTHERKARILSGRGRGGANSRAIFIQGVRYESIAAAKNKLKRGYASIYDWISSGRARYAGPHE